MKMRKGNSQDRIRVLEARTKAKEELAKRKKKNRSEIELVETGADFGACFKSTWKKEETE